MIELAPCPFCGSKSEIEWCTFGDSATKHFRIRCLGKDGHALDCWDYSEQDAKTTWNTRI